MRLSAALRFTEPRRTVSLGVYIVRRRDGLVKIGMSEDLAARVASYGRGVELLHTIRTEQPREAERVFHSVFRAFRVGGEWFDLKEDQIEFLRSFETWPREGRG